MLVCFATAIMHSIVVFLFEPLLTIANNSPLINRTDLQRMLQWTQLRLKPIFGLNSSLFRKQISVFCGHFFLCRIIVPIVSIKSISVIETCIVSNLLLDMILLSHLLVQPFQKNWHNKLDCAMFVNLITINTLTIANYYTIMTIASSSMILSVHAMILTQILHIALPLVYIYKYTAVNIYMYMMMKLRMQLFTSCHQYILFQQQKQCPWRQSFPFSSLNLRTRWTVICWRE